MKRVALIGMCAVLAFAAGAGGETKKGEKKATASIRTEAMLGPDGVDIACMCSDGKIATTRCSSCNQRCDCGDDGQTPTITCLQPVRQR